MAQLVAAAAPAPATNVSTAFPDLVNTTPFGEIYSGIKGHCDQNLPAMRQEVSTLESNRGRALLTVQIAANLHASGCMTPEELSRMQTERNAIVEAWQAHNPMLTRVTTLAEQLGEAQVYFTNLRDETALLTQQAHVAAATLTAANADLPVVKAHLASIAALFQEASAIQTLLTRRIVDASRTIVVLGWQLDHNQGAPLSGTQRMWNPNAYTPELHTTTAPDDTGSGSASTAQGAGSAVSLDSGAAADPAAENAPTVTVTADEAAKATSAAVTLVVESAVAAAMAPPTTTVSVGNPLIAASSGTAGGASAVKPPPKRPVRAPAPPPHRGKPAASAAPQSGAMTTTGKKDSGGEKKK